MRVSMLNYLHNARLYALPWSDLAAAGLLNSQHHLQALKFFKYLVWDTFPRIFQGNAMNISNFLYAVSKLHVAVMFSLSEALLIVHIRVSTAYVDSYVDV